MTEALTIELHNRVQAWAAIKGQLYPFLQAVLQGGHRWILTIKPETRTQAQNRLMWPLLTAFSKQLKWPVNGSMVNMTPDEWKDVLTAAFYGETMRLAMGLNGGVVMLGRRTSKFNKKQFSDWIEFLYATGADRGVDLPEWSTITDPETGEIVTTRRQLEAA
jgi:hypothetical protein